MLNLKCTISGKSITGSVDTTYSAANSTQNASYESQNGVCVYHKVVSKFRTGTNKIPVQELRDFSQKFLANKTSFFDVVEFRGKYKKSHAQMDAYLLWLRS